MRAPRAADDHASMNHERSHPMRKTLATLAAVAAAAAAFGTVASPASADDPNPTPSWQQQPGVSETYGCFTMYKSGVYGQYGAWGNFIDGCTVSLRCPADVQRCDVNADSFIENYYHRNERVTMNQVTWRYDAGAHYYARSDRSCNGYYDRCDVHDTSVIAAGQYATVRCNGVRAATSGNQAMDRCGLKRMYR